MVANEVFLRRSCVKVSLKGEPFLERRGRELTGGCGSLKRGGRL